MRWVHHHLPMRPPTRPIDQVIAAFARLTPRATFVQVGAHDGTQLDPLRHAVMSRQWTGVMVEPVPYVFHRLAANYARIRRVSVANVAIADIDGTRDFYHLGQALGGDQVWQWYDALGSFRRDVVLSHTALIPDIEDRIITTSVPCVTFDTLCRQHGLTRVDLVQIDTEGYDYEVVKLIDLERYEVQLLMYENLHLDADTRAACETLLRSHGYDLLSDGMDTLALHDRARSSHPDLDGLWSHLSAQRPEEPPQREVPARVTVRRRARRAARQLVERALTRRDLRIVRLAEDPDGWPDDLVDKSTPLPEGAADHLRPDNPRLLQLKRDYAALDWPVVSHSRWQQANLESWLDLQRFRGDNSYVWHYREAPRVSKLKFFVFLEHIGSRDHAALLERLDEDGAFGCWTYTFAGRPRVSRDLLDAVNELSFLDRHLDLLTRPGLRILDIGAGYGRLAHRTAGAAKDLVDYCCVDAVPHSTFLCEYYATARGISPTVRVVPLNEVPFLEPGSFDVAFNVHSFSECTVDAITWWMDQLRRLDVPTLFLVPNEPEGFLSLESDGSRRPYLPVIEAGGYELSVDEPAFDDLAVRELLEVEDRHCIFRRSTGS